MPQPSATAPPHLSIQFLGLLAIWIIGYSPVSAQQPYFTTQFTTVSKNAAAESEPSILALIQAGVDANAAPQAASIASDWLRQNIPQNPETLYHAARAAEFSGAPDDAIALYQQYILKADPLSPQASDAITAIHTLLIDYLAQPDFAYSFARNNADRLSVNPTFRQWDTWFLAEARRRNDPEALASRLLAILNAKAPADLIIALHDDSLDWLLTNFRTRRYDIPEHRIPATLLTTTKSLAAAIAPFDPEYALLLDAISSIRAYNMARIDGNEMAPPLAEAKAVIDHNPHHALLIQTEWAGGSTSQHYREDPNKYYPHQAEQKFAPILAALPKLDPVAQTRLIESWSPGHYARGPEIMTVEALRDFVLKNPTLINHKAGPNLRLQWDKLTLEEAAKLAPVLTQNPSTEASLIHAILAAGEEKDLGKAIDALIGPHAWRLTPTDLNGTLADRLWHYSNRPGGNERRDQEIARSKQIAETATNASIAATAPENQRLQAVRQLLADSNSNNPKTPAVLWRLRQAISFTPEAVPELLRNDSSLARLLIQDAIAAGFTAPDGKKLEDTDAWSLEPVLRARLAEQLEKSDLDPWLTAAWLQRKFPAAKPDEETTAPLEFFTKLSTSPKWAALPTSIHRTARAIFNESALNPAQLTHFQAADPKRLCAPLLDLPEEADAPTIAAALEKTLANLAASPIRRDIIGLERLDAADPTIFADPQVLPHLLAIAHPYRSFNPPQNYGQKFFATLRNQRDPAALSRSAAYLWRHVEIQHRDYPVMIDFIGSLADDQPATLIPLAAWTNLTIGRYSRGHSYFNREDLPKVDSLRGRALMDLGLIVIPVAPGDPAYPVYQAQADWVIGNEESASKALNEHWDVFLEIHRSLNLDFLMWTLDLVVLSGDKPRQESFVTSMVQWAAEASTPLALNEKARIEIALGDVALQRGQITQAEQIFTRVQNNEAYQELPQRTTAALRRVRASLAAKDHDGALTIIAELEAERIPSIWENLRLARAEVFFDMERFDDASDDVRSVLQRDPANADALLLMGQVQIKNRRYIEASELEIGSATDRPNLVPGENLKVTLNDPGLSVSGAGVDIEVTVTTTSGDSESFFLRRFGDEKTRFRGEIPTALGSPNPNDGTLQVIGDDEIFYAYSDGFRQRANLEENMRGGPITVASDAMLMVSARQLLTASEQRIADLEAELSSTEGTRLTDLDAATRARLAATRDSENAPSRRSQPEAVKPGNPIHIRVIDPDRSRTATEDEVIVSATSSSGDSISRFTLRETGPHTGWFEGSIPSSPAPPMAFAPNSEPGRNPNSIISPRDDYPAWRPLAEQGAVHELTIDLNDRASLGEMRISATETGRRITRFALQTANRHGAWQTIARHPATPAVPTHFWQPTVTVVRQDGDRLIRSPRGVDTPLEWLSAQLENEAHLRDEPVGVSRNVAGIADAFPADIPESLGRKDRNKWQNLGVVHHFTAWFHEPQDITRRFELRLGNMPKEQEIHVHGGQQEIKTGFILSINGRQIAQSDANKLEGEINLRPGLHRLELWAVGFTANIGYGRTASLRSNLDPENPAAMVDCPPAFFDPATFPATTFEHRNAPANIVPNDSGDTFTIAFAPDSQARLIRLLIAAHEGPAPAINRIALNSKDGKQILPTRDDYATLRQNESLEILPDDTVSIRYADDRPVTRGLDQHERFLRVAFTDARLEFADIEPRFSEGHGENRPYYERILRFKHGEPLSIVICDGDMDTTTEPDNVLITLKNGTGGPSEFTATETGPSTGIFRAFVTPTPDTPSQPDQFQVAEGGTITVVYLDRENTQPGVPTDRITTIGHAQFSIPEIHIAHASVTAIDPSEIPAAQPLIHGFERLEEHQENRLKTTEQVHPRWRNHAQWQPASKPPEGGLIATQGTHLPVKIEAPHIALRAGSTIQLYAQTDAGRRAAGRTAESFDINVPGTIELTASLIGNNAVVRSGNESRQIPTIPIYQIDGPDGTTDLTNTREFLTIIPIIADVLPNFGVVSDEEREEMIRQASDSRNFVAPSTRRNALVARPGENIHLGIQYNDASGTTRWLTTSARIATHPTFDILEEDLSASKSAAYIGETLHLRVIDLGADLTDDFDTVQVLLQAKSGASTRIDLRETGPHTGIFQARVTLGYTESGGPLAEDHNLRESGFPVIYGDTVAARYTDPNGVRTDIATVTISKGADGELTPFSKIYDDPEIATQSQFSLAEAYLELSRRYRQLKEVTLADQHATTARQLLASVTDQFTDADTRAHAEYLLGQLTLQEALVTEDPATKELRFRAALSRFMTVTGSFPDTLHASNAQFRIATIYEALGENDVAAQEYVKLAYKYPQSEFLATSMARLGSHFLRRAAEYEEQSKTLLAKAEAESDLDAEHQGNAMHKMAVREYLNTARIFGRLSERFPSHELAAEAGLRAGQSYMRATQHRDAVNTFLSVANNTAYDGPEVRAQAMYWAGMNYQSLREEMAAFAIFQRITYDFPESQWAAFARGQLSQERMLNLETRLELQRLEADQ